MELQTKDKLIICLILISLAVFVGFMIYAIRISKEEGLKCVNSPMDYTLALYNKTLKDFSCTCSFIDNQGKYRQLTTIKPKEDISIDINFSLMPYGISRTN